MHDRLLSLARRELTPCGEGQMVWHVWGAQDDAHPVVLLHGGSGSWTHWLRNIEPLIEQGRRVLVPDLPGFGDSAHDPNGHDADPLAPALEQGLQQLVADRACDVVGFSFGAMVAGFLAVSHPARLARLVLVGAPALGIVSRRTVDLRAWRHLPTEKMQDDVHRHNLRVLMLHDEESLDDEVLALHRANALRDRMLRRRLSHTDVLAQSLRQFQGRVWAIYGAHDALYQDHIQDLLPTLQSHASGFTDLFLIENAGHWVQYEAAHEFNEALAQALLPAC